MAINYRQIEAGGTSTDLNVSVDGLNLVLEMTQYTSGIHQITRTSDMVKEVITFNQSYGVDTKVTIWLIDDPETATNATTGVSVTKNEGTFVVDICRQGIDNPYQPDNKLVMWVGQFIIPKAGINILNDCTIDAIKVVGTNG